MDVNVLFQKMNSMAKNVASRGAHIYLLQIKRIVPEAAGKVQMQWMYVPMG